MNSRKAGVIGVLVFLSGILFLVVIAVLSSWLAYRSVLSGDEELIKRNVQLSYPLVSRISALARNRIEVINCWQTGLQLLSSVPQVQESARTLGESYQTTGRFELQSVETAVASAADQVRSLRECVNKSSFLRAIVSVEKRDTLLQRLYTIQVALNAIQPLFTDNQTWVVMFQNTTELRPTGGFTGSYGLIEVRDNVMQTLTIEDIYDADGQVVRFRDAPPGVDEYTSGKNGLRLPDANWWPDFPTSAQAQLDFLADAGKKNLRGLAAVNLTLLQRILGLTGPLDLPDYQTTLTAENAPLLLRSHAEDFFPGSSEKKQLLAYTLQQLQYRLASLNTEQKKELLAILLDAVETKDIQLFSTLPEQQAAFEQLGIAGRLDSTKTPILALVEANVGINKSNQFVTRSLAVEQVDTTLTAILHLKNIADLRDPNLSASQSGYVNFQRIVTSPEFNVSSLKTDTNDAPKIISNTWSTDAGQQFNEKGLLLSILPGQTQTITIELERSDPTQPFLLWHQPGTGETPLTVSDGTGQTRTDIFDRDLLIAQ